MEKTLATRSPSKSALHTRIENLESAWIEFQAQYDRLHTIASQGRLPDQVQAKQDRAHHATFQHRYVEVHT